VDAAGRRALIEKLCSFEGRGPGTDSERRAADWLAERLREMGRRVEIEPTYVHPEYAVALALHVALAVAGSLVALVSPPTGFVMVLFAAVSLYLDQNTRLYLLRRLLFRRASQNVVSPGPAPEAPARVILSAHYDAAKTGWVFGPRSTRTARGIPERLRLLLGPIRLVFWAGFVPLLLTAGLRLAGIDATWLGIVQLLPTFILLLTFVLLVDIALSAIVPGAYDNASGVAAVLSAAEALDAEPPQNLDVWVLLPGAEECNAEGMAAWIRRHRKELDRAGTYFINLDSLSYGTVHYLDGEGAIVTYAMDRRLRELCAAIAASGSPAPAGARPIRIPFHTDALPTRARGFRAISLIGAEEGVGAPYYHTHDDTPDKVDDEALSRSVEFTVELVRALDRDVGRSRQGGGGAAPVPEAAHQV
jgi:hypothetical protein